VNKNLWLKITDTFDAALELPPHERISFATEACKNERDMLEEVCRLLREFENAGEFLERPFAMPSQAASAGDLIARRYRVEALVGRGGMGEVYRVHDELLDEPFALKTLRPELCTDAEILRRFFREIRLARQVTHPNVCRVFEVGIHLIDDRRLDFFVMQLLEGETLAARIRRRGRLSPNEAFPLIQQMAEGLQAAHDASIVHRDFKSSNVILCQGKAVITDFGLARPEPTTGVPQASGMITVGNLIAGTIAYMSPEQLSGEEITSASDIYSLGVVLFEMATGQLPFDDRHIIHSAMQRATDSAPDVRALVPDIDPEWARAITQCLQRDPAKRFLRAADVASRFRSRAFRTSIARVPLANWSRRQWVAAAVISAAGMSSVPFIFRLYRQDGKLPEGVDALLTPIANSTGDARFEGITELLRAQLSQSAHVNLLGGDQLVSTLKQMGKAENTAEPSTLREAAWRLNAALSIFGNVTRIGPDYALGIQIETRGSQPGRPRKKLLRSFPAGDANSLMTAVHDASTWVRETVGESASNIASFDRLPADATTSSWEALASFARGQRFFMQQDFEAAILEFESALRIDPAFTLAALRRADLLFSQNRQTEGFAQYKAAIAMLEKRPVTRAEELYGRGMFAHDSGDLEASDRYYRTWSLEYPFDWRAPFYRVSSLCMNGNAAQGLDLLRQLRTRMPEFGDIYAQMVTCHLILGQTAEAHALVPELRKRNRPERADLREAYIRFREANCVGCLDILRSVQRSTSYRRGAADAMLQEGLLLIDAGYPEAAAANIEAFLRSGSWVETIPEQNVLRVVQGWSDMLTGQRKAAVANARLAVEADTGPLLVALTGTIFARLGAADLVDRAVGLCSDMLDIRLYRMARLRILGERAKAAGQRDQAIELLRNAAALEPKIAHRQYLIEALPEGSPERLELCLNVIRIPWQNLRPPLMHHIGAVGLAVAAVNATPGIAEPFAKQFAESSRKLGKVI
jgi:eukaryotic-like serine/threonine-protein kinase